MTDKEMFGLLIEKDPDKGLKNRIKKPTIKKFQIPGWVFNSKEDIIAGGEKLDNLLETINCNKQILYDILILGLTNINDRPKCYLWSSPKI